MFEFDLPLHPVMVHFPIVLGVTLPLIALVLWWMNRKLLPASKWPSLILVAVTAGYFVSAYVAAEFGEDDEEIVEQMHAVPESALHEHEEAGERVVWIAGILLGLSLGVAYLRRPGALAGFAGVAFIASFPLVQAAHLGGQLVYQHGAAQAHIQKSQTESTHSQDNDLEEQKDHKSQEDKD